MKTIIGFDSWTQGSQYFERLVEAMELEGYKLILIHVGSWGHDNRRPVEEMIGKLLVRDISYYKGLSFPEIIQKEKPAGVLFLSMQAYVHRAFNRYCKYLGIPTMHLYHGLVSVQAVSLKRMMPINWKAQLSIFYSRIFDNIGKILPSYMRSLWETKASSKEWGWFVKDIWRKIIGNSYSSQAAPDASTDLCCVYTNADVSHAVQRYRMPPEKVKSVGNPDLFLFGLKESLMGAYDIYKEPVSNDVIYIDTALIACGAAYDSEDDFINHLKFTANSLQQQGYNLVVKLHPAHYFNGIKERLIEADIKICEKEKFIDRLVASAAAIVEPSSAAMIPALIGVPLLLGQYGKLSQQNYGEVLYSYPRSRFLKDINEVKNKIKEIRDNFDREACCKWVTENAGPMPPDDMPKRVIEAFKEIMK
jgi:hypothetical protein